MNELMKTEETVIYSLRSLYHKYGYSRFKMSKFEPYDLYMQNKEFLVSEGVITFTDTDGTLMALKPDVTLSIVKNFRRQNTPLQKVCYNENVYRCAGTGCGYREIMQTGLECLGNVGLYEISEVIVLAVKSLRTISDNVVLDLSHMDIVTEVLSQLQLSGRETEEALRCMSEKNGDALVTLLGGQRAAKMIRLMRIGGTLHQALPLVRELSQCEAVQQLEALSDLLDCLGLSEQVHLDFSIDSSSHYYNGFVFRGYVEGVPAAVLAGGQYDRLMEKMNKQAKGIGFAVYLDQLEQLDRRSAEYDVDTVLLYDSRCDLLTLTNFAEQASEAGVFMTTEVPRDMKYRRLLKICNGRVMTVEEHG